MGRSDVTSFAPSNAPASERNPPRQSPLPHGAPVSDFRRCAERARIRIVRHEPATAMRNSRRNAESSKARDISSTMAARKKSRCGRGQTGRHIRQAANRSGMENSHTRRAQRSSGHKKPGFSKAILPSRSTRERAGTRHRSRLYCPGAARSPGAIPGQRAVSRANAVEAAREGVRKISLKKLPSF